MLHYPLAPNQVHPLGSLFCLALELHLQHLTEKKMFIFWVPSTFDEWKTISDGFHSKCSYPFCIGALDGKHITIKKPDNSGSEYFNCKGYFTIVLLAIASYDYKLIFAYVGASGRYCDAGLFESSSLKAKMDEKSIGFPEPDVLWYNFLECHYHVIRDDAFPLKNAIMKPFDFRQLVHEDHIFNYRLSGALSKMHLETNCRKCIANRFRVLLAKIMLKTKKAPMIVLAIWCLHNLLTEEHCSYSNALDTGNQIHEGSNENWHFNIPLSGLQKTKSRTYSLSAKGHHQLLKEYFCSKSGLIHWQDDMVSTEVPTK